MIGQKNMKINEKGTNMKITAEIKDYLYKKLESLNKFISAKDGEVLCEIELGKISNHHKKGCVFMTEINLTIDGKSLRAVSEQEDLFSSIDIAKDEISQSLKLKKDKKLSLSRKAGARIKELKKNINH